MLLLIAGAAPSYAVRSDARHKADAKRFGLDQTPNPARRPRSRGGVLESIKRFNAVHRRRGRLGFGPAGVSAPAAGPARVEASRVAREFLRRHQDVLGIDPGQLRLEVARTAGKFHHLLFVQIVDGVPVEFSRVKVHLTEDGEILDLDTSYRENLPASPIPTISETRAALAVAADAGLSPPAGGRLVYFPLRHIDDVRLAWKFRTGGLDGSWLYYIDAHTGKILFRYNDLRFQTCQSSGTITGEVYDIDPTRTPLAIRPMAHQDVFVIDATNLSTTDANGFFCSPTPGRIFTSLQGNFVNVANFNGPNAIYQNGGGIWKTKSSPISSAHPYPNNSVIISTINITDPSPNQAVMVLPIFATFDVGSFTGDIQDNDQVAILDSRNSVVATYVGQKGAFHGAAVRGSQVRLRLSTNESGQRNGFDISISSYLVLDNAIKATPDSATASFTWTTAHTCDGTRDEINLFYQINLMRDYFDAGVNHSTAAFIDKPLPVMARVGPGLANAFYDPVHGNLSFGDVGNSFAMDGTVVRHEYVHYVIDQIYPIINFAQNGAISEAVADYFSGSSFNLSKIGEYVGGSFGVGALRDMDCAATPPCQVFPTDWFGTIHEDSLQVSQALWEIREGLINNPPPSGLGQRCADGLVFQTLFFFPDSYQEFLKAMLLVSANSSSLLPECGADNSQRGLILAQFATHGIIENPVDADVYEPNNGIQSATDISTAAAISARVFPGADLDYYAVPAGAGPMTFTLTLPANAAVPGTYFAFGMTLVDQDHEIVATGAPPLDINPTLSGFCPETNCLTSSPQAALNYHNPGDGQFNLLVSALPGDFSFVSKNNSTLFYTLSSEFNRTGPIGGNIVAASFDNDTFSYTVAVSSFARTQNYLFSYAQLRDHALTVLPRTATNMVSPFLVSVSSNEALGRITGTLRLQTGFAARFPAVGTVHLEIFGVNPLGQRRSLGLSPEINMTTDRSSLRAWNNVFNPARGQKTTVKYEITEPGHVLLRLFTRNGRLVRTLLDAYKPAGKGSVDWFGRNFSGGTVASGLYLLHIQAPGLNTTRKVIVVK